MRKPSEGRPNSNRLPTHDYSSPGAYFITIRLSRKWTGLLGSIHDGELWLWRAGEIVKEAWLAVAGKYPEIILDAFVVMPDHFHGVLIIPPNVSIVLEEDTGVNRRQMLIPKVVGYFKMNAAKRINQALSRSGPVWQRGYHDAIIRSEQHLQNVRRYIRNNPSNWKGLRPSPREGDS